MDETICASLPILLNPILLTLFRLIFILPFIYKVLEACLHKQFSQFIYSNNSRIPFQSDIRPGHSMVSALLKVTGDIKAGMEYTNVTTAALFNFSNAFNTVSPELLLAVPSFFWVSDETLDLFSYYLQDS